MYDPHVLYLSDTDVYQAINFLSLSSSNNDRVMRGSPKLYCYIVLSRISTFDTNHLTREHKRCAAHITAISHCVRPHWL